MTIIHFGPTPFDADLIVFDKDGTLIDFEYMWGRLAKAWIARLATWRGDPGLQTMLYQALGYDPVTERTIPKSPLALSTTEQTQTIVAATLYRHGVDWIQAEEKTLSAFEQTMDELSLRDLIRPAGDVVGLFTKLREQAVHIAIITTDRRQETEETLALLQITPLVEHLFCGDDGLPWKPAPDTLLKTCDRLGVPPNRTVMVGDTEMDLLMGKRAGVGLRAAVLTGAGDRTELQALADIVLQSIDEIAINNKHPA